MIYKDKYAHLDHENLPEARLDGACINCGNFWGEHQGWGCDLSDKRHRFSDLAPDKRYLTQSMKDSISGNIAMPVAVKPTTKKEPFKTWEQAIGRRVRCIFPNHDRTGKTGVVIRFNTVDLIAYIKWDDGSPDEGWGYAFNFEPLDDNDIPIGNTSPSPSIHHATVDLSDWKVWAKQPSGHCACGIVRAQCTYHKG